VSESSQPDDEEEESEPTLMHRKRKLHDQVGPQVGVVLGVFLALDLILI